MAFTLQFTNGSNIGSFYPDGGFTFTDRLNATNEANFLFTSSSVFRRSQIDIGTIIYISEKDSSGVTSNEFYGFVDDIQTVDGGGLNVHALGQEAWLGKQTGAYAGSPWTTTSTVTIFNAIVAESTHITAGSSDSFGNITFRETNSDSLWNAIMNLNKISAQDVDVAYSSSGATVALKNSRGLGGGSRAIFNQSKEIGDISVGRSMPVANNVIVYGSGEGTTRIKSTGAHGQNAGSQAIWGVITKIVNNYSINSVDTANSLADAEVAVYASNIKTYQFSVRVKKFKTDFIAGDIITLNSIDHGLTNEDVTITEIEKGMQGGQEYMNLTVTNSEYARQVKNSDMMVAQNQLAAQNSSNYDQYQPEYSNQNCSTCIGGTSYFCANGAWNLAGKLFHCVGANPCTCFCDIFVACYGSQYLQFNAGMTVCIPYLQVGTISPPSSSINTLHNTVLDMCNNDIIHAATVCATCFIGGGTGGWCGTAGSNLNMNAYCVYGASMLAGDKLNINASSSCVFYVSGTGIYNGTLGITYACTTCTCVSRKMVIPVGTNCY